MTGLYLPPGVLATPRVPLRLDDKIVLAPGRTLTRGTPVRDQTGRIIFQCWFEYPGQPKRGLRVLGSIDQTPRFGPLCHISVSRMDCHPSWEEITLVRDAFYPPTIDVMMVLPRHEDYVNLHEHCFHLNECPTAWGMR